MAGDDCGAAAASAVAARTRIGTVRGNILGGYCYYKTVGCRNCRLEVGE